MESEENIPGAAIGSFSTIKTTNEGGAALDPEEIAREIAREIALLNHELQTSTDSLRKEQIAAELDTLTQQYIKTLRK